MFPRPRTWITALLVITSVAVSSPTLAMPGLDTGSAPTAADVTILKGTLASGGRYLIEYPPVWAGKLLVWNPGYSALAGAAASDAPSTVIHDWLLRNGYALAGTAPAKAGWTVEDIMADAIATVHQFSGRYGRPRSTIAWGFSMGGQVTAGLVENHPDVFDGGLPMCGSVAGPVAMLNAGLDAAFALKQLLAPTSNLQLVNITEENARNAVARAILDTAQASPAGRARIALAASFAQLSPWSSAASAEPNPTDYAGQEVQQYSAFLFAVFSPRQVLEQRAGGNFTWNTGVDYADLLARSGASDRVTALYQQAGLNLADDLAALAAAQRISAVPSAVAYMGRNFTPTGQLADPVLTLNEYGDNAPTIVQARAYADAVKAKGNEALLRQAYVHRPGHCGYRPAETMAAVVTLDQRITTGTWGPTDAASLNQLAAQLAAESSGTSPGTPGFATEQPVAMLRSHLPVAR